MSYELLSFSLTGKTVLTDLCLCRMFACSNKPHAGANQNTGKGRTDMFDIEKWSKERVHEVMLELLTGFNYMWFLMEGWLKQHCPEKAQSEEFLALSGEFGAYEVKRLGRVIKESLTGVDRLIEFVRHSHWCAFEDLEITKISDKQIMMRTVGCSAQKAAKRWGLDHYACGDGGLRLRQGFFAAVDPSARVERVFTPPDERPAGIPEEVSCQWLISID